MRIGIYGGAPELSGVCVAIRDALRKRGLASALRSAPDFGQNDTETFDAVLVMDGASNADRIVTAYNARGVVVVSVSADAGVEAALSALAGDPPADASAETDPFTAEPIEAPAPKRRKRQ